MTDCGPAPLSSSPPGWWLHSAGCPSTRARAEPPVRHDHPTELVSRGSLPAEGRRPKALFRAILAFSIDSSRLRGGCGNFVNQAQRRRSALVGLARTARYALCLVLRHASSQGGNRLFSRSV